MILKQIFGKNRVIGIVGDVHTGKTNNLIFLLDDFRKYNRTTPIYIYGFKEEVAEQLVKKYNCSVIETLEHMSNVKNGLICCDEFQRLKIGDRRYKSLTDEFFDFIYHNNNWVIMSSPNMAEFNKLVCNKIKSWLFKSLHLQKLVNGSEVKRIVESYKGERKRLNRLFLDVSEMLFFSEEETDIIKCDYMKDFDSKKENVNIFVKEKCQRKMSRGGKK